VEDHVINLVVAMNERPSIFWLHLFVFEEVYHIVKMRYRSHRFISLGIPRFSLKLVDCRKGLYLPVVKPGGSAIALKTNIFRLDLMELGKRSYGIVPPILPSVILLET
jgi:hypothetical protein